MMCKCGGCKPRYNVATCCNEGKNNVSCVVKESSHLEEQNEAEGDDMHNQQYCCNVAEVCAQICEREAGNLSCESKADNGSDATECKENSYNIYECLKNCGNVRCIHNKSFRYVYFT